MKTSHYILMIVFFFGLSLLNALVPIDINTLIIAFLIIYLLHHERED